MAIFVDGQADDAGTVWTGRQKFILALCALAIVLDGFDTQVIGFAAPALLKDWGITKLDFAPVPTFGLIGMTIGAAVGGLIGDRIGRKFAIIASVVIFGALTAASALASNVTELAIIRFMAGLGLGGALPNVAAMVGEFTPPRQRSLAVAMSIVCVPLGGVVGGLFAAPILPTLGWQGLFVVAGIVPVLVAVLLYVALPESPQFLRQREEAAQRRATATPGESRPDRPAAPNAFRAALAQPNVLRDAMALWVAFFVCLLANFLYFNWLPVLLTDAHFDASVSTRGLLGFNLGGVIASVALAAMIGRFGSKVPMVALAVLGVVATGALAVIPLSIFNESPWVLLAILVVHGGCVPGLQVLLYALAVNVFPVEVRASGVGSAAGVGRIGAVAASALGAAILAAMGAPGFFLIVAASLAVSLLCVILIRRHVPPARE